MTYPTAVSFNDYVFDVTRLGKLDGLTTPSYAVSESVIAGARGSRHNRSLMRKRQITLEILLHADTEADYFNKREALLSATLPDNGEGELTITLDGVQYLLNAVPQSTEINWPQGNYAPVQVQFVCYDPTIYSSTLYEEADIIIRSGGGLTFPLVFPLTFVTTNSGTATATNGGNVYVWPVITLSGLMTNPLVRNLTTDEYLQLTYTSGVNDEIVIDMANRTIVLNGVTSLITELADGSDFWNLQPGDNEINISTGSSSDTGTLTLTWRYGFSAL